MRNACDDVRRWLSPYDRAKKLTDVHRVHVFDVETSITKSLRRRRYNIDTGVTANNNSNSNITADESAILLSVWSSQGQNRIEGFRRNVTKVVKRGVTPVFEHSSTAETP